MKPARNTFCYLVVLALSFGCNGVGFAAEPITLKSLLAEMADPATVAPCPASDYQCLQASNDNSTVLKPQAGWWGEGEEKIFVDGAWDKGFQTHFSTVSEDYYGWADGENPTRADEFSTPFLANDRVGGLNEHTQGYNIRNRTRALDAIPFQKRLVFDMESSIGVDIRQPWDLLGYSVVTCWYAKPGATHNRPALPNQAARPISSLEKALKLSATIQARHQNQPRQPSGSGRQLPNFPVP